MANGTHVDELTPAVPADLADSDLVYVGLPGDADPDRKMTLANLRAYLDDYFALLTGATFSGDIEIANGPDFLELVLGRESPTDREARIGVSGTGDGVIIRNMTKSTGAENYRLGIADDDLIIRRNGSGSSVSVAEYGSNTDGRYVRFYNRLQVCWHRASPSIAVDVSSSKGGFLSAVQTWTYPAAFISSGVTVIAVLEATGGVSANAEDDTTTQGIWRARAIDSQASTVVPVHLLAFGQWF